MEGFALLVQSSDQVPAAQRQRRMLLPRRIAADRLYSNRADS